MVASKNCFNLSSAKLIVRRALQKKKFSKTWDVCWNILCSARSHMSRLVFEFIADFNYKEQSLNTFIIKIKVCGL